MLEPSENSKTAAIGLNEFDELRLTIVAPCYNESEVIALFYRQLVDVLDELRDLEVDILFVDDGSTDDTLQILDQIARNDDRVRIGSFSRNFGHQNALTAGLEHAEGDAVITMDCDLQHPPRVIPELIEKWREGYDIVSGIRKDTKGVSQFKKLSSRLFYALLRMLSTTHIPTGAADFCLLSRRVCNVLQSMPERHRFLRGLISWVGFDRALVSYDADERAAGRSKYSSIKMLRMAIDAILSFSTAPIRMATRVGYFIAFAGFAYLVWNLVAAFMLGHIVPGWASLIGLTMLLGGSQLIFIGIIGQYLARVFEESKARPLYVFKREPESAIVRRSNTPIASDASRG